MIDEPKKLEKIILGFKSMPTFGLSEILPEEVKNNVPGKIKKSALAKKRKRQMSQNSKRKNR